MSHQLNIARIIAVTEALQELASQVVFVGGSTLSFYTDRQAEETRPTDDVDILFELATYWDYVETEEKLRKKGFSNDMESQVQSRFRINGIVVDVMATRAEVLGFGNQWYPQGFENTILYKVNSEHDIRIFPAAYFLATKFDAFNGRGNNDGRQSHDFEDIVYLLNNRSSIWSEIAATKSALKTYLLDQFSALVANDHIAEWISCNLEYHERDRTYRILGGMQDFVDRHTS